MFHFLFQTRTPSTNSHLLSPSNYCSWKSSLSVWRNTQPWSTSHSASRLEWRSGKTFLSFFNPLPTSSILACKPQLVMLDKEKNSIKRIIDSRKSVRELGCQWKAVRWLLDPAADFQLQKEMDRILLLAVNYITANRRYTFIQSRENLMTWLPYLFAVSVSGSTSSIYRTTAYRKGAGCGWSISWGLVDGRSDTSSCEDHRKGGEADCRNSRELFSMQPEEIAKEMRASRHILEKIL